ncbi:M20 family metallopeptidase [Clostridioides difficile]
MKEYIINNVEEIREELIDLSKKIWENPELAFEEKYASSIQKEYLKSKGFKIEEVENLPTGFIASFGEGKPVIGILGEYDALPELSQCVSAERKPLVEEKAGHGCGHNLLGVAGVGAVVSIKKLIEENKFNGTIKYFGCPAEEEGGGKTAMCINGCFDDVDCAFTWHPFDINAPWRGGSLANLSVKFKFKGITAHAAQAPHNGRSALDAVEIMNVGANYLREHVIDSIRMHYVITNGGGRPNVVPGFAESWYFIRGKKAKDAEHVLDRLIKVAQGAAMMTETEMEYKVTDGIYDYIPNQCLTDLVYDNMVFVGCPKNTPEEEEFAKKLCDTLTREERLGVATSLQNDKSIVESYIHKEIVDGDKDKGLAGSTDVGDVSYVIPVAQFAMAAWPVGIASHTWQSCSSAGSNIGFSAMINSAKVLACSAYDVFMDTKIIDEAKIEFDKSLDGQKFKPLV